MRGQVEIARHFVQLDSALNLTTLFVFNLFFGLRENDIWVSLFLFLLERVSDSLSLSILVKIVFVESSFDTNFMHACHIYHV